MLLIASLNYMNMATARTTNRSKEIGMRKVIGAVRGTLIKQFISESMVLVILALILAFAYRMNFRLSLFVRATLVPFILSLLITLVIAFVTISFVSVKAAQFNPVEILSREQ